MNTTTDGRATRWEAHNAERRRELVAATLRVIRAQGPTVGMDEIAAAAGTSKPVFYRHFGGRAGLYHAVVEWVHEFIWEKLPITSMNDVEPEQVVHDLADTYLGLVEKDPAIYQFVISRPSRDDLGEDPVQGLTVRIGNQISDAFSAWLERQGQDTDPANIWGHGVVGFTYSVADRWIITNLRRPRSEVVAYIEEFFAPKFEALRSHR